MDYAASFVKLCWGPMLELGKGCFWELFSPEWASWMADGDKAPTSPSYCHPWASGVTHWLSGAMAGIVAVEPGYARFAAMPHVSGNTPHVRATQPTPHGPITVSAQRDNGRGTVAVDVQSSVAGLVGLRLHDEATGCALDLSTVRASHGNADGSGNGGALSVPGAVAAASDAKIDLLHPTMQAAHAFVAVAAGRTSVSASFRGDCVAALALADNAAVTAIAERRQKPGKGLPTIPPFAAPSYPASWSSACTPTWRPGAPRRRTTPARSPVWPRANQHW